MATVSATCDRLGDLEAPAGHAPSLPLRVSSNPVTQPATHPGAVRGALHPGPAVVGPVANGQVTNGPSPLTHRRRSRWFELNPGCFGQAALTAGGVAAVTAAAGGTVWLLRRARRL